LDGLLADAARQAARRRAVRPRQDEVHIPKKQSGTMPRHRIPHPPQLFGSVRKSETLTQTPEQHCCVMGVQAGEQTPVIPERQVVPSQVWPDGQVGPLPQRHVPDVMSHVSPVGQPPGHVVVRHMPLTHCCPLGQVGPPPQRQVPVAPSHVSPTGQPPGHVRWQEPPPQVSVASHMRPQVPQFTRLVLRSVQMPLQQVWPALHALPAPHLHSPAPVAGLRTQFSPAPHAGVHATAVMHSPPMHSSPAPQATPQPPQFASSLVVSRQRSPQHVCPKPHGASAPHRHPPAVQRSPRAPQESPHPLQLLGSVWVSTQDVPQQRRPGALHVPPAPQEVPPPMSTVPPPMSRGPPPSDPPLPPPPDAHAARATSAAVSRARAGKTPSAARATEKTESWFIDMRAASRTARARWGPAVPEDSAAYLPRRRTVNARRRARCVTARRRDPRGARVRPEPTRNRPLTRLPTIDSLKPSHWNRSVSLEVSPELVALLGLPFVADGHGSLAATSDARAAAGPRGAGHASQSPDALARAAAALLRLEPDDAPLRAAIEGARAGRPSAFDAPAGRAVALPLPNGAALVLCVPEVDLAAREALHEAANALSAIAGWARKAETHRGATALAEALAHIDASARRGREAILVARTRPGPRRAPPASAERGDGAGPARRTAPDVGAVPAGAADAGAADAVGANGRPVDVGAVAREAAAALEPLAGSRGVSLVVTAEPGLAVRGDEARVYAAISNLLKNAVEAAPVDGHARLTASRRGGELRVVVTDDGPGLAEADARRALAGGHSTKEGGSGLGLSVARAAARALGGEVTLAPRRPHGARAVLTLPWDGSPAGAEHGGTATTEEARPARRSGVRARLTARFAARAAPGGPGQRAATGQRAAPGDPGLDGPTGGTSLAAADSPREPVLARQRVLVVEDDPSLRRLLASGLEAHGAVVWACADAAEARAARGRFDAAVSDVRLRPRAGDGALEGAAFDAAGDARRGDVVLAELQRAGALVGPVVLVSGAEPPEDLLIAPAAVVRKPFDLPEVVAALAEALGGRTRPASSDPDPALLARRRPA
jgi:signal transduction histidine kinase/CheY-like chemotaxis protein